jgi:hypothetical protein
MEIIRFIFLQVHRTTDWNDLSEIDYGLICFNACEALFWFGCACYAFHRNGRLHRVPRENLYSLLFILFGLTDVVEVFQVSSPLIWIKLAILVPLFLVRRQVLATYTPKPRLI